MSMEVDMKTTIFVDRRGRGNAFDVVRQSGRGMARRGRAGHGTAVVARQGRARQGKARRGKAVVVWQGNTQSKE